jgi:G3E family GTPase
VQLIVITGMRHSAKTELARALIEALTAQNIPLTVIDNGDEPLKLGIGTRLAGGCVCCSLAAAVIPLVWRLKTDYGLLLTSSSSDPETLYLLLDSLRGSRVQITTIALVDDSTKTQYPYLAQKFVFYSDLVLYEPFVYEETVHACLRLSL